MKIRFLGTGTSTGVPEIGCSCETCSSADLKDKRLRASVLLEIGEKHLLIDCSPDFREQMLHTFKTQIFKQLNGVLITHEHYDHVGGLDDLRAFCRVAPVPVYAQSDVIEAIRVRMPYAFRENKYPGVPELELHEIDNQPFEVEGMEVIPIRLLHGKLPILGFRIGNFAYLTDLKTIPETEYCKLTHLDVLVINALRPKPHIAHETIEEALQNIERIRPKCAYFTHLSHAFGRHEAIQPLLPHSVFIGYDGLEVEI